MARLEAQDVRCWIAPRDLPPASDWAAEIIDAIACARIMVLVFSSSSNQSPQVRREVERAVHKRVNVLPFRIEDVLPSKSLEYFLSAQHWMDAFPPPREPHYDRLASYLKRQLADPASAASQPPPTAVAQPAELKAWAFGAADLRCFEALLAAYVGPLAKHLVRRAAAQAHNMENLRPPGERNLTRSPIGESSPSAAGNWPQGPIRFGHHSC